MLAKMAVDDHAARRARLIALVALIGSIAFIAPSSADASATPVEQCLLDQINKARADVGSVPLSWAPAIEDYTRRHSADMAARGDLIHSDGAVLGTVIPAGWNAWGENIGWHSNPDLPVCTTIHDSFMASPNHRDNLLNPTFRFAATGTFIDAGGGAWTTHVFFANTGYTPGFEGTFADDDGSNFEADIEKIAAAGITSGCGGDNFCPNAIVTRGQMAAFLSRALHLPPGPAAGFLDAGGTFAADIDSIVLAGITQGCELSRYCPNAPLTRAQMAVFLVRAFNISPSSTTEFTDSLGHRFEDEINRLASAGVTLGCGDAIFCPDGLVTRGQMAAFLARALNL